MPQSYPDSSILLKAAIDHLETSLYPKLSGQDRYLLRVTINALRIVERELLLGSTLDDEEAQQLRSLMGAEGEPEAVLEMLTQQIEAGSRTLDDPELTGFLKDRVGRALKINNPGWMEN